MDEQIRLMDQNLKCLSAAEEKVLTIKPTESLHVWCGFVFVLQLPPLHRLTCWVLSHLFMECSILSHLLGIFHLFFPSWFTASPQALSFPWVIWGIIWVGHTVPISTPRISYNLLLVLISLKCSLLVSKHSKPRRVPLLTCSMVEGGGLMLAQVT